MPGANDPRSFNYGPLPQNQPALPVLDFLIRALQVNSPTAGLGFADEELERRKTGDVQSAIGMGYNTGEIPKSAIHKRGSFGSALQSLGVLGEPKAENLDPSEQAAAAWGAHLHQLEVNKNKLGIAKFHVQYLEKAVQAADKLGIEKAKQIYPDAFPEDFPVGNFLSTGEQRSHKDHQAVLSEAMRAAEMGGSQFGDRALQMLGVPTGPEGEVPTLGLGPEFMGTGQARSRTTAAAEDRSIIAKERAADAEKQRRFNRQNTKKKQTISNARDNLRLLGSQLKVVDPRADPQGAAAMQHVRELWIGAYKDFKKSIGKQVTPEEEASLRAMTPKDLQTQTAIVGMTNVDLDEAAKTFSGKK